jgi:hypothetical protein
MKNQLLHAPIGGFSDVDFVFRRTGKLVGARELLQLASGAADDPKHLAVERNLGEVVSTYDPPMRDFIRARTRKRAKRWGVRWISVPNKKTASSERKLLEHKRWFRSGQGFVFLGDET